MRSVWDTLTVELTNGWNRMSHEVENTWNRLWSETLSGLDAYIIIAAVVGLLAFLMLYLGSARSARS